MRLGVHMRETKRVSAEIRYAKRNPWDPTVEETLEFSEVFAKRWAETEFSVGRARGLAAPCAGVENVWRRAGSPSFWLTWTDEGVAVQPCVRL
jgi:hypothetical protein